MKKGGMYRNLLRLKAQNGAGKAAVPWIFASFLLVRKHILLQPSEGCRSQEHYNFLSHRVRTWTESEHTSVVP